MLVEMTLYRSSGGVGRGMGSREAVVSISWINLGRAIYRSVWFLSPTTPLEQNTYLKALG